MYHFGLLAAIPPCHLGWLLRQLEPVGSRSQGYPQDLLEVSASGQTFLFEERKLGRKDGTWAAVRDCESPPSRANRRGEEIMLGIIAAILIIGWLLGLFAFHVSSGLFHVLLVVGLILLVLHFLSGRRVRA